MVRAVGGISAGADAVSGWPDSNPSRTGWRTGRPTGSRHLARGLCLTFCLTLGLSLAGATAVQAQAQPQAEAQADDPEAATPSAGTGAPADYSAFVPAMIEGFAIPAARDLEARLGALDQAIGASCADHADNAAREGFAKAFTAAVDAHGRLSALRAGALADDARAERLAFVPDSRGVVRRQVTRLLAARDASATDPASLRDKSVALQGLTALEWIAFDKDGKVVLGVAGTGDTGEAAYACAYAKALGARLQATAHEVGEALQAPSGQTALLLAPGPDNALAKTDKEAASFVFNALLTSLELARDQVVGPLLAEGPVASRAARLPFSRSHAGFASLAGLIDGISGAVEAAGFAGVTADANWIGNSLAFEARNARRALEGVDPDPSLALSREEDLARLAYLRTVLDGLRPLLSGELAAYLDFKGGFNALDGD